MKSLNGPGGATLKTGDLKSVIGPMVSVGKAKMVVMLVSLGSGDTPGGSGDTAGLKAQVGSGKTGGTPGSPPSLGNPSKPSGTGVTTVVSAVGSGTSDQSTGG